MQNADTRSILDRLRRLLLAILAFGLIGTSTELWLLGHYEDIWQWLPLVLSGLGLVALAWHGLAPRRASLMTLRGVMVLVSVSGFVGTFQHYRGNVEFERELSPNLGGFTLFAEAMQGATPALAPGTMTLLGLLGLAATFRQTLPDAGDPP
jgi:hypothetical protein